MAGKKVVQTMGELLAKSASAFRSLLPGQTIEGIVIGIGGKSIILDVGSKSEGVIVEREFAQVADFVKSLKVGDKVSCEVLVPETNSGQALLSLRPASTEWAWLNLENALKEGLEVSCFVENTIRGGLSVSVFGLSGFIPNSHLGSKLSVNIQSLQGSVLKVKVIELDREKSRVVLSEKAVSEAELIAQQEKVLGSIKVGDKFKGRVVGLADFGAFVRVEKNSISLDGLVHLSQVSWKKIANVSDILKEGETVEVVVIGKEGPGRLSLSIKETLGNPWDSIAGKYKTEAKITGRVVKTGDMGAFVELEPGVEGLLRSGKIPAGISIKEGETIDCFIEEVDEANHKISLGLVLKAKPVGYK